MVSAARIPALYPARPTISLRGQVEAGLSEGLRSMVIEEDVQGLARCELSLSNFGAKNGALGFLHFDRQSLDFGVDLAVTVGAGDAQGSIFDGRISALEGRFPRTSEPEIAVLAEDRLQDLRMTRRTRSFERMSDADLVGRIASDHGLRAEVQITGPTHTHIAQVNQSDLAFLRGRLAALDAELVVDGRSLRARPWGSGSEPAVELQYGERLMEASLIADLATQRTAVVVSGWNVGAKETIEERAEASAISGEVGGGTSGPAALDQAFGARVERLVHTGPADAAAARAWAEGNLRRIAREFVRGRLVSDPDARFRAGGAVELTGVGELFDGRYTVTSVRHEFDRTHGLRSVLMVQRAALGGGNS